MAKLDAAALAEALTAAAKETSVPGASIAVLQDGEIVEAATGVLNLRTGVEATTDSLFQIGSITKVYTASLVMLLVDAGLVDLDAPVRKYLPEFRVADEEASAAITVRHLLTHTSGFDGGDYFFVGGRGDDTLERYVAGLVTQRQISPVGKYWSYNNAGFAVLGRIIEVVTGQVWDDALRERLFVPADLDYSVTLPEEALLFRAAVGHQIGADGLQPATRWFLDRSSGPMGAVCATAHDVAKFARMHLDDGGGVLSPASAKAMRTTQVPFSDEPSTTMGLGWMLRDLNGVHTFSHNGGTLGQLAFLMVIEEPRVAVVLLTNGLTGGALWPVMLRHVTEALGLPSLDAPMPELPAEAPDVDLSKYAGRFVRQSVDIDTKVEGDQLMLTVTYRDIEFDLTPPPPMALTPIDEATFVVVGPDGKAAAKINFFDFDGSGRPELLFLGRLSRRVDA